MSLSITTPQTTNYRAYIDGLRAVAILSVVGFHNFPSLIRGGFVGVDIFFVISGFLISTLIFQEIKEDTFSYRKFYARRIKRLFPALATILLATLIFGYLFAFPDELILIGKQIAGSTVFLANFIFYSETGYFDTAAESKPLLHLWSLGIEEQYYILWPLLVTLSFKKVRTFFPVILFFLIVSFFFNVRLISKHPSAVFYLPATRFWELLIGSMLAYVLLEYGMQSRSFFLKFHDVFAWAGASLIITSLLLITENKHFPGYWALLPTIGAFFILTAGDHAWFNRTILANRVLVFFGLISYPLYLWHWSLLVFVRIVTGDASPQVRLLIISSSILLAWLTYQFIEKPVRFGKQTFIKPTLLIVLLALFGVAGGYMYASGGIPDRSFLKNLQLITNDLIAADISKLPYFACPDLLKNSKPHLNFCYQSSKTAPIAAVFGDSHAAHVFHGIAKVDHAHSWLLVGNSSCEPVSAVKIEGGDVENCQERAKNIIHYLKQDKNIHTVVLSFFGNIFKETAFAADHIKLHIGPSPKMKIIGDKNNPLKSKLDLFQYGIENTVSELESAGKKIIIITDVPELPFFPKDCLPRRLFVNSNVTQCNISKQIVLQRQDELRAMLQKIQKNHPNVRIFDTLNFMCNDKECRVKLANMLVYRDSHHLSLRGSELFAKNFLPWFYQV